MSLGGSDLYDQLSVHEPRRRQLWHESYRTAFMQSVGDQNDCREVISLDVISNERKAGICSRMCCLLPILPFSFLWLHHLLGECWGHTSWMLRT